ncbi:hypothetical protein PanWU01x14_314770 [Parasponia andersonii]|uniref:Uncharacterized protein n=1 Tax=Parasponia andersonii TaxID=3476 RepID=A0A2P5ANQ7_PARAD|nr:hypothetical protein PanWU01x14_314770 [Parasponia andersonii]
MPTTHTQPLEKLPENQQPLMHRKKCSPTITLVNPSSMVSAQIISIVSACLEHNASLLGGLLVGFDRTIPGNENANHDLQLIDTSSTKHVKLQVGLGSRPKHKVDDKYSGTFQTSIRTLVYQQNFSTILWIL